ncbi:MAG: 16S rRNA (uracil(1498)-N(3))-methyltransferase [Alphaproteobacteria bacterium]|nr:16S rRNA (uracil(1498)-N(3))-methyltransferase [Alphaproteobacteria bacterium]
MQNVPRIYIDANLESGQKVPVDKSVVHYLCRVMRRNDCLVFNNGIEYHAVVSEDDKFLVVKDKTNHIDPSNNLTLCFAPIKRLDDLLNMATQMGVRALQPVITERTVANHINWERMKKIIIEAAEQSNRNSVPNLYEPVRFGDLDLNNLVVADERFAHDTDEKSSTIRFDRVLVGPEGGFSPKEFEKLDSANVAKISLGKTVLRAEVAAVVAIAKVLDK